MLHFHTILELLRKLKEDALLKTVSLFDAHNSLLIIEKLACMYTSNILLELLLDVQKALRIDIG